METSSKIFHNFGPIYKYNSGYMDSDSVQCIGCGANLQLDKYTFLASDYKCLNVVYEHTDIQTGHIICKKNIVIRMSKDVMTIGNAIYLKPGHPVTLPLCSNDHYGYCRDQFKRKYDCNNCIHRISKLSDPYVCRAKGYTYEPISLFTTD